MTIFSRNVSILFCSFLSQWFNDAVGLVIHVKSESYNPLFHFKLFLGRRGLFGVGPSIASHGIYLE